MNLLALTDLHHPERSAAPDALADLLWFPTGGGKTEAYLGLTAYTLAIRRLQGTLGGRSGEEGVAVLMRYTLRLLTLQQFQRATALICACEMIRREALARGDQRWGTTPFRIGLWVGQRATPNWTEDSAEVIKRDHGQYRRGSALGGSSLPAQLTTCPWCGAAIKPDQHIKVDSFGQGTGRTYIYYGDPLGTCPFSQRRAPEEGLPVLVVDEEIYRRLPALLIATVDKFAQMPWNGLIGMLFGLVNGYCPRHGFRSPELEDSDSHPGRGRLPAARTEPRGPLRPPDLIIQDELHLISGPLGTLVGLYESVIDRLASWEMDGRRVRPKVVASTATIQRASEQVRALFLRKVTIFPPHGLDAADNFFSLQRPPGDATPGRRYLGICAPGHLMKNTLIRVYVAYMAAAQTLYERYGRAADPWMTLVGYFNSIRELAGMRRLVDDDVRSRLLKMDARGLAKRLTPFVEELTSRKSSTDIPEVLDRLEVVFDPVDEAERQTARKTGKSSDKRRPYDVLLATNMVSVGVDVRRLGLMVVAGQPKTTAEYIQATSAHALMRQLSLACGYTAASLRERIYSLPPEEEDGPMAGVLIYTAAADSEGTLGGLVGLGTPEQLDGHIEAALERMRWCASDPLCAEHTPVTDLGVLHAAACHACLFVPETSYERGNKYLDRSLLIPTVEYPDLAFFRGGNDEASRD